MEVGLRLRWFAGKITYLAPSFLIRLPGKPPNSLSIQSLMTSLPSKTLLPPSALLFPLPAVLVSCGSLGAPNLITISWTGTICSDPPMCYISIRPERYSWELVKASGEFVINLCDQSLLEAADWCGVHSGRDFDKFRHLGFTPVQASTVGAPLLGESPVNIECRVVDSHLLGSHEMFIAKVSGVNIAGTLTGKNGQPDFSKAAWITYNKGYYHSLGEIIGRYGYTRR